ncbi:amino acid adenylation domain-containing protein [Streptomyces sp. NPDC019531]|uniref:amino acid adenylation domain-containing protein n=1 Tax=Streptomyces sp. NPDC019531 TaxID=3365062 RepID=UPI00384C184F
MSEKVARIPGQMGIRALEERTYYPVSSAQRRMLIQTQMSGGDTSNKPMAWTLRGKLDIDALCAALDQLIARHEMLRTGFHTADGHPLQFIDDARPVKLVPVEVLGATPEKRAARLRDLIDKPVRRPFDLSEPNMLRAALFRLEEEIHVLLLVLPNVAVDEWSTRVLREDLGAGYAALCRGKQLEQPVLPAQYRTYAQWERDRLADGVARDGVDYWTRQLADVPPPLQLPVDRPRYSVPPHRRAEEEFRIPPELVRQVRLIAARNRATPFMVYLAAYQLMLSRWTREPDIVVGVPAANRLLPEFEQLIGFFVNTLALRSRIDQQESFTTLLEQVRCGLTSGFEHQDIPFDHVLEIVEPQRSTASTPLLQAALVMHHHHEEELELPGLEVTPYPVAEPTIHFQLVAILAPAGDALDVRLSYPSELLELATIRGLFASFIEILHAVTAQPMTPLRELDLLSPEERKLVSEDWARGRSLGVPPQGLLPRILGHAAKDPDAVAVDTPVGRSTFGELLERSLCIAAALRASDIGVEDTVGVCLQRSPDLVGALLGIWMAGAAFVPLDPSHPAERLARIMADADVRLLVTDHSSALPEPARVLDLSTVLPDPLDPRHLAELPADRLAYVIYTSGTSGNPKGVEITHRSLDNLAEAVSELFCSDGGMALNVMSPAFDGWLWSTLLPLAHGLGVALRDGTRVAAGEVGVDAAIVTCTPSLLGCSGDSLRGVGTIVVAGEPCPASLSEQWRAGRRFVNAYGPTETTICATFADSARGDDVTTIGRPLANMNAYVLDEYLRPLPVGVPGELFIGGEGVGRGYRGRPELTERYFLSDPFVGPGARMYRTGDLARWREGGQLEFLGRIDDQVKIRGFRVELAELERVASAVPAVRGAAAFITLDGDSLGLAVMGQPSADERLRIAVHQRTTAMLPDYMRPSQLLLVDALPLTAVGKIDRSALAKLSARQAAHVPTGPPPSTETEQRLAALWTDVLGQPVTDVELNFFEAGGHSLLIAKVIGRLRKEWQTDLTIEDMLDQPTIAGFARLLEERLR